MRYSKRVGSMQASPVRKLVPYATEAKKKGVKVYHLNIGQPDIKTPEGFMKAIREFDESVLAYADSVGSDDLLDAMIKYYKSYDMEFGHDELLITNGGSEALLFAMLTLCNPGENILVPEPFYTNYNGFATCVDVEINPVTTLAENGDLFVDIAYSNLASNTPAASAVNVNAIKTYDVVWGNAQAGAPGAGRGYLEFNPATGFGKLHLDMKVVPAGGSGNGGVLCTLPNDAPVPSRLLEVTVDANNNSVYVEPNTRNIKGWGVVGNNKRYILDIIGFWKEVK